MESDFTTAPTELPLPDYISTDPTSSNLDTYTQAVIQSQEYSADAEAYATGANIVMEQELQEVPAEEVVDQAIPTVVTEAAGIPAKRRRFGRKPKTDQPNLDRREPKVHSFVPIVYFIGPVWILVIAAYISAAISGLVPVSFFFIIGYVLDALANINTPEGQRAILGFSLGILGIAIVGAILYFFHRFFTTLAEDGVTVKVRHEVFQKIIKQETGYFDIKKVGALLTHLGEDTTYLATALGTNMSNFFNNISRTVAGVIASLVLSYKLALCAIAISFLAAICIAILSKIIQAITKRVLHISSDSLSAANEIISSIRTVRAMAGEEKEKLRYDAFLKRYFGLAILKASGLGIGLGFVELTMWGTVAMVFGYGSVLIRNGELTAGNLFSVFGMMLFASMGFSVAFAELAQVTKGVVASKNLLKVLLRKPAIVYKGGVQLEKDKVVGKIVFKDVDFAYPSRPDQVVMKNFNLTVEPGQQVALVGQSGSGKSTTVGLLERFYEPLQGSITIDDVPINTIDPFNLHTFVGIVAQEPVLFAGTIRANIAYTRPDATMEEIIAAAKAANAHDFIMKLHKQYDTIVGERGVSLSGGQKQRIAIARVLIQNPRILLLDEATSALDTQSEHLVQNALNTLMKGRTSIVIAHRLATIKNADQIIVMEQGKIVEKGTHEELLQNPKGHYSELASKQMLFNK